MKPQQNRFLKPVHKNKLEPKKDTPDSTAQSAEPVPRITNETVATHREDVLKDARKYIYPLQHSKNRIILITSSIIIALVVFFFTYCTLALYKFQDNSTFLYKVTQVIPFPIARVDGHFISYNNYLFELQHYIHYYQTQQKLNFNTASGQQQLADYKTRALDKVLDDAYVSDLAAKNHVMVSNQQLNDEITIYREQNRLGDNQSEFESVLKDYYGWDINDFKRELKNQLLAQNLVSTLDTATHTRANNAYAELQKGADFATLAGQVSDDTSTKANGGQYGYSISSNNVNLPIQVVTELFTLKAGQISPVINTGGSLEIDKVLSIQGGEVQAAHIVFNFQDINNYLNPLKEQQKARVYITPS
jgi:parvulin-like peptidyl-prolyl isomerase